MGINGSRLTSFRFREMKENKMFRFVRFWLPWTREAHARVCVCVCVSVWIWSLLPSFPSGQAEAVQNIVFSFFLSWKGTTETLNSLFTNTVPKPVPSLLRVVQGFDPQNATTRPGKQDSWAGVAGHQRTVGEGESFHSQPLPEFSSTPHCHPTSFPPLSTLHGVVRCC